PVSLARRNPAPSASDQSTGVKCPASESVKASANTCACQGSSKVGSSSSLANGTNGDALIALKVTLPKIKENAVPAPLGLGPQLGGIKSDRVKWLSSFLTMRVRVGKNVGTMERLNPAPSTAHVGRQPSVAQYTMTFRSHGVPSLEYGRLFDLPLKIPLGPLCSADACWTHRRPKA